MELAWLVGGGFRMSCWILGEVRRGGLVNDFYERLLLHIFRTGCMLKERAIYGIEELLNEYFHCVPLLSSLPSTTIPTSNQ